MTDPNIQVHLLSPDEPIPEDQLKDAILMLEDKLCSLEAYYHGTKTPSKRIVKALIKRAQYHMRRTRSMYLNQCE
jgi:hypothetical protein